MGKLRQSGGNSLKVPLSLPLPRPPLRVTSDPFLWVPLPPSPTHLQILLILPSKHISNSTMSHGLHCLQPGPSLERQLPPHGAPCVYPLPCPHNPFFPQTARGNLGNPKSGSLLPLSRTHQDSSHSKQEPLLSQLPAEPCTIWRWLPATLNSLSPCSFGLSHTGLFAILQTCQIQSCPRPLALAFT